MQPQTRTNIKSQSHIHCNLLQTGQWPKSAATNATTLRSEPPHTFVILFLFSDESANNRRPMGEQLVGGGQYNQVMPSHGQYINFNSSWYIVGIDHFCVRSLGWTGHHTRVGSPVVPRAALIQATPRVRGGAQPRLGEYVAKHARWRLNGKRV